jgi:FkbM family methyltransferase
MVEDAIQSDLIFDVGMNNGDDTAYYLRCGFKVIAIEADPTLCEHAASRFTDAISAGKLKILNVAISEQEGNRPFYICDIHSAWSSFDRAIASRNGAAHHAITVRACQFSELLEEHGLPFYLKIDIEGKDWLCVEALTGKQLPRYLSIEQSPTVIERLDRLRDLGFVGFKCIGQENFLPLQKPISNMERDYSHYLERIHRRDFFSRVLRKFGFRRKDLEKVREIQSKLRSVPGWQFPAGSSGAFGEDTRGRWLEFQEFKETILAANAAFAAGEPSLFWGSEPHSFWADFHMRSASP